jgi:plastocyanin
VTRPALVALALGAALAACGDSTQKPPPVPPDAIPAGTVLGSATITGRAVFTGTAPQPVPISMSSDAACHKSQGARTGEQGEKGELVKEDLVVGAGGALKYVFVRVVEGLPGKSFAPPAEPVTLDQRGCTYRPHVVGVQVGQQLLLVNSDPTLHNVHTVSQANKPFNFGMSVQGQKSARYFSAPEVMVKARCDVHPWMASWIGVVEHPFFAVTGDDGRFVLKGLPAGEYTIEAWSETLGTQKQTVTVSEGETKEITLTFAG